MKKIAISLQKGGTGKTSLSVTLGAEFAKTGKTVILDCDPQGSATSWLVRGNIPAELADLLYKEAQLQEVIQHTTTENLDIIPTAGLGGRLKEFSENRAGTEPFCFVDVMEALNQAGYKFVVLDLSPSFGLFERDALTSCDEVLTPIIPDFFGLDGLQIFAQNLKDARQKMHTDKPEYRRIVLNAVDNRIGQYKDNIKTIYEQLKEYKIYQLPVDPIFRKAQANGETIQGYTDTKTETLEAVDKLAQDIIIGA